MGVCIENKEIIALIHVLKGRVITRGEAEWNFSLYNTCTWLVQLFPKLHQNTHDYLHYNYVY